VWGTKDRVIPAWHATTAHQAIPGSRVELFEGSGHYPHLDDPERFAALLEDFVADRTAAPARGRRRVPPRATRRRPAS
jgi:pimeloyl-ACP methyl ester carboxylesterase